ncbi:cytochrome P450 [Trichoderma longibrachiatum]|uniref:Cytochrome P450 n=1 Tax=Trichoderma longibrachiatum ATCC 18648 TaxID=983965 RepID=A0A2T4C6W7_TRILO|nr:cytochrome P450 [Trichoderma longibrachiatum ATCC 18648]
MSPLLESQYSLLYFFLPLLPISYILRSIYSQVQQYRISRTRGCKEAQSKAPVKDPFIGLDFIWDCLFAKPVEKYLDSTYRTFQRLGSTYVCRRWTWEAVYTCDSRNIKHVLASGFEDFKLPRLRVNAMTGMLGSGIFTLNGKSWSHARGVLRPCFAKQNKESIVSMLETHFQALLGRIPADGTSAVVDLQPLFFWLTMDFATHFLMGRSTHVLHRASSHAKEKQFLDDYLTCSTEIVRKMQLGPLQMFSVNFAAMRARSRVFRYIDDFISASLGYERREEDGSMKTGCNVLQGLAAVTTDRKQLRDQILHILVASRDTTACLLSNLFFVLARKPHIYEKLRREVISIAGVEPVTSTQLNNMEYLKWCVQESLRLHPVIPTNAREASRDTVLPYGGGEDGNSPLFIKKGNLVMYNIYAMHRDAHVFGPDPEEFVPERWNGLRPGWGYLPFNGGPRICIGQKFALLETHYLVSRMVQTFETMSASDDAEWVELYALATTCKDGVNVRLTRS